MARTTARELIRQAQVAELDKDIDRAVALLKEAARLHIEQGEGARAVSLYRYCLKLRPGDAALQQEIDRLGSEDVPSLPETRVFLELPQRGPVAADPALGCWCSFCCSPKAEVGPMVAGPAGAFICGACARLAASLAGGGAGAPIAEMPRAEEPPASKAVEPSQARDFIEAAVRLSRELRWSLSEIRGLSEEERRLALETLDRLTSARDGGH